MKALAGGTLVIRAMDINLGAAMALKPVLVHVDEDEWDIFKEICGNYKVSRRVRELVRRDIDRFTREEVKAQSLAGLTEA